jgi:hypothetical protein
MRVHVSYNSNSLITLRESSKLEEGLVLEFKVKDKV